MATVEDPIIGPHTDVKEATLGELNAFLSPGSEIGIVVMTTECRIFINGVLSSYVVRAGEVGGSH